MKRYHLHWLIAGFLVFAGAMVFPFFRTSEPPGANLKTEDLERKLALGIGTLPQTITMENTEIFRKNGANNVFALQFVEGELLRPSIATVLSDEVCEPDANNFFHCWNNIELPDGTIIRGLTVHDMMGGIPCLSPGTKVFVSPYKEGYFLLQR